MSFSNRCKQIKPSPTFEVLNKAQQMQKQGQDVIILATGEPDFDTPEHIKQAAIKAINDGKTKYTPVAGTLELKTAIQNKFLHENKLEYNNNQIIVSNGGKHSIFNALMAIINKGDEVIIPAPFWVSYPDMVKLTEGIPIIIECGINNNFKLLPDQLEHYITDKTRAIILNSPSNPTGMVYTKDELSQLAEILIKYPNIYILTDDLYEHLIFDNKPFNNILNVMPELKNRTIVINGVSKAYSMTGWRIGYAACHDATLIKTMEIIQSQSTSNPCSISQAASVAALNSGVACITDMLNEFKKRHDYVITRLNNIKGLKCLKADGAFYAFFDCTEAINNLYTNNLINSQDDLQLANYLLDNYLVAGVPGSAFGLNNFMRISFATNMHELTNALDRIQNALNK